MGAWIETIAAEVDTLAEKRSHPVWVRGLKQRQIDNVDAEIEVAPRVGAWIETI